jgi:rhodanese-related sulfurtransferase
MSRLTVAAMLAGARVRVPMLPLKEGLLLDLNQPQYAFIDVREAHEREAGWIPGSIHAPRSNLEWHLDPYSERFCREFSAEKTFIFVCGGGGRAALSAALALEFGLRTMWLEGGMTAWRAAGGPIALPPPPIP